MTVPDVGTQLGSYRLEALLGRGGMGVVYRATDERLGRKVALKLLASHLTDDPQFRQRFLTESRLAASIDHAGIVPIYEAGEINGQLFIAMRYVEGTDLASLLRDRGPMAADRASAVAGQMADALDAAHERGLVHGRISPERTLIVREGDGDHVYLEGFALSDDFVTAQRADLADLTRVVSSCLGGARPRPPPSAHIWRRRGPQRRLLLGAMAGGALVLAAVAAVALPRPGHDEEAVMTVPVADADAVVAIDPGHGALMADVPVGTSPTRVAVGARSLWVANVDGATVSRIDLRTRTVRQTIAVGDGPDAVAFGAGAVWVANGLSGTVSRISPATNRTAEVPIGNGPVDVCVLGRSVWVADAYDNSVVRLDPATHRLTTVDLEAAPTRLACGARSVWVTSRSNGTVTEVDAQTATPRATVHTGQGASGVALQGRSLWVANTDDGTVSRVDRRRRVQTAIVALGPRSGPTDVAVGGGGVWVASGQSGTLTRIDPSRPAVDRTLSIARRAEGLVVADRALWAAVRTTGGHHRGGTLRVAVPPEIFPPEDAAALDPATTYYALGTQLLGLTNDGLVTFARVGGRDGETVVADLAEAVPEPTDGGRTYTFRLRSGLRYATGAPIRASHLRHAIERFLRRGAIPPHFYTGIRGAAACARRPASCDLSSGIEVDDRARTITFRLVAPDGDFLSKLALPFAVAIPPEIGGATLRRPVPATGPYAISRIDKRLVRMMRNPYFRPVPGRPAAYPDAIELHHASNRTAVREVEEGRADYVNGLATAAVPREDAATIATRFPGQMHGTLLPALNYMVLNTRVPPFDDLRVRRAVNFAVDRDAVTRISGGALGAEPACQLVPPNFPGRRPYCPYTRDAGSGRPWTGPDLPRARRLIAAAHVRGMRVTVVGATVGLDREARYMTGVLNRLGFRVRTRLLPANRYFAERRDPDRREQISVGNWGADYPSPATFLQTLFGCAAMRGPIGQRLNRAQFCDARAERLMARAGRLPAGTPESDAAWVRAERRVLDQAPAVPLTYGHEEDLVSARVRHYAFNFQDGPLLEQMWVR